MRPRLLDKVLARKADFVLALIDKHEISSSNLELEITENAVMKNFEVSNKFLERCKRQGSL